MDHNSISKQLRQYSQDLIAYKMGAEFADACNDAADAIERLRAELERATKERCKLQELAHSQRNGLEQLRGELERVKREKDAAVAAYHERLEIDGLDCDYCKHTPFGGNKCPQTDEEAEHCDYWEWRGPQKEE